MEENITKDKNQGLDENDIDIEKNGAELRESIVKLQKRIKVLEETNSSQAQFIANVNHELRTPMNGIIGIVELLENTRLSEEQKNYLRMLKTSSETLVDIIGNVLDMSLLESNKIKLKEATFDIKEDINSIVNQLIFVGNKKNIKIMYYIEPLTETSIRGDKQKLNQVLINLMNNAIKYTEEGHIFLSVKKVNDYEDKVTYQFSIEDTGIGIEDSFKDTILGSFNQGNFSYDKKYSGSGLGLAISKRLVEMMNGEIWFESKKDFGSTFYFTVEFKKITGFELERKENSLMNETHGEKEGTPMILVVEDNEINKKLAVAFLSKKGYDTVCANNGIEAIEEYKNNSIDIILMDIQMPEMNGFDATIKIRELEKDSNKHIPIIAMTAYAMTGDREKCLGAGMDDYISKPISSEILYDKIGKYINVGKYSK